MVVLEEDLTWLESEKKMVRLYGDVGVSVEVMHYCECLRKTGRGWKVKTR
jgi:hypothetical protein